jgi:hypothetical protein
MMTDTFDPSTARIQLEKFTPVPAIDYLRAFHPEHETTMEQHRINEKIQNWKLNPIFISAMDPFQVLSKEEIEEWFPGMINMIPVAARLKSKGRKTPAVFEDAQAMAKAFPDTFQAPSQYLLNRITVGSQLKVCVRTPKHILVQRAKAGLPEVISERFRVIVTAVDGNKITGVIDHIVQFIEHNKGDEISFEQCHVYQIL